MQHETQAWLEGRPDLQTPQGFRRKQYTKLHKPRKPSTPPFTKSVIPAARNHPLSTSLIPFRAIMGFSVKRMKT